MPEPGPLLPAPPGSSDRTHRPSDRWGWCARADRTGHCAARRRSRTRTATAPRGTRSAGRAGSALWSPGTSVVLGDHPEHHTGTTDLDRGIRLNDGLLEALAVQFRAVRRPQVVGLGVLA